ncbi:NADH dehydrogenase [ubiquinone] iron-sulfur protein 1, mitochondrial [Nymphon striatum]|nr:NADH dehydrogenase [ubiquinone] iron-sulfur protein 1, mitochondrial [Nymphon striatum]
MGNYPVGVVGDVGDLRLCYEQLGSGADTLKDLVSGKNKFAAQLKNAKKPMIIVGQGALNRSDSEAILGLVGALAKSTGVFAKDWNGFNVLHTSASQVGGLDLGFVPGKNGKDTSAMLKDYGCAFQKSGTYVNTEGRVQMSTRAAFAPGDAKEDWAIVRALSAHLGVTVGFDSLSELRSVLYSQFPHFARLDEVAEAGVDDVNAIAKSLGASKTGKVLGSPLTSPIKDYFMTNPIARASKVMAECSALRSGGIKQAAE